MPGHSKLFAPDDYVDCAKKFRVQSLIGSGKYGEVWLCRDTTDNKLKAVKAETHRDGSLEREIRIYQHLGSCKAAPTMLQFLTDGNPSWMVLTFEGESFGSIRSNYEDKCVPERRLLALTFHAVKAFKELHTLGIVHRDVRSANICLSRSSQKGRVIILDFGLSQKCLKPDGSRAYENDEPVNFSSVSLGSLNVMNGGQPKELDDLHSFVYVMLHMRNAWFWHQSSREEILQKKGELMKDVEGFLYEDEQFLVKPIQKILEQRYDRALPDYDDILATIRAIDGFDENAYTDENLE